MIKKNSGRKLQKEKKGRLVNMKQWILEKEGQLKLFSYVFIFTILCASNTKAGTQIEVWTDEQGIKHYENAPVTPATELSRTTIHFYTKNHLNIKFIPITINNIPLEAIIDTGASYISLNADSIRQLNIKTFLKGITINTSNGITNGYLFIANSIKVGNIELNNIKCVYIPASKENLIGGSFLSNFNYFFNEREQTISLIPKKEFIQYKELFPKEKEIIKYKNPIEKEVETKTRDKLQILSDRKENINPTPLNYTAISNYNPQPNKTFKPPTKETSNYIPKLKFSGSPLLLFYFIVAIPLHLLIIWFLVLAEILKNEFTGHNKIVWILVVILIPIIGLILYGFIGKKQIIEPTDENINAIGKYTRLKSG